MITAIVAGILIGAVGTGIYESARATREYRLPAALALLQLVLVTIAIVYVMLFEIGDRLTFVWASITASVITWAAFRFHHHRQMRHHA